MIEVGGVAAKDVVASYKTFRMVLKKKRTVASSGNHSGGCFSPVVGRCCLGRARSFGSIHGGAGVKQCQWFDFWRWKIFRLCGACARGSGNE